MEFTIRHAMKEEHDTVLKIARSSKYTKDFGNRMMFSSDAQYDKGWIFIVEVDGKPAGMACVRHKVREHETVLYFINVLEEYRKSAIAKTLIHHIMDESPWKVMALNVMKENPAVDFYLGLGFSPAHGDALGGEAYHMKKEFI